MMPSLRDLWEVEQALGLPLALLVGAATTVGFIAIGRSIARLRGGARTRVISHDWREDEDERNALAYLESSKDCRMLTDIQRMITTDDLERMRDRVALDLGHPTGATMLNRNVVTRSGGNARHCAYLAETTLTCEAVRTRGVRRTTTIATGGDARGAEAQVLYVENVRTIDGVVRDLAIVATMGNVLHAYDLRRMQYAWETPNNTYVARPITNVPAIDMHAINDHWGILSTPVIDEATNRMYACMWASPDGTWQRGKFSLIEVDLRNGDILRREDLSDVTYQPPHGLPLQRFDAMQRKQRCSLLLQNGSVYVAFGTIAETGSGARGWILRVSTKLMAVQAAITTTARGQGGGIWMGGQGLSADAQGFIHCTTGNGDFDGVTDFGECFLKLDPVTLKVVGWWSPFSDNLRTGRPLLDAPQADSAIAHAVEESQTRNFIGQDAADMGVGAPDDDEHEMTMPDGTVMRMGPPTNKRDYDLRETTASGAIAMGAAADMDLGSGGSAPIDKYDCCIGAGKDGIAYLVRCSAPGNPTPHNLRRGDHYGMLLGPPQFFTIGAPQGVSAAPKDVRDLNYLFTGKTPHMHSTPVYHEGNPNGDVVFCWGENSTLKAYKLVQVPGVGLQLIWLANGAEYASAACVAAPGGMPGGMMALSANGPSGAVLWASVPVGDGNMTVTQGRLLVYDASDFSGGTIKKIWDSQDWGLGYVYNKFCPPTIANGRLLLNNYSGGIDVYELA